MRVDLFYDLLRFSPRSIDLFISMNISPPSLLRLLADQGDLLSVCCLFGLVFSLAIAKSFVLERIRLSVYPNLTVSG